MKTINNIYEASILADIDDQFVSGDFAIETHLQQKIYDLFDYKKTKCLSISFSMHARQIPEKRKQFIDECCYWDDEVLVIDFNKSSNKKELPTINIFDTTGIPKLKLIDNNTKRLLCTLAINANNFDFNCIDSNSIVNSIEFRNDGVNDLVLTDNKVPINVKSYIKYKNCKFNKIYPKNWPMCKLEFNKQTWLNILRTEIFNNKNIQLESILSTLMIN